MLYNFLMSLKNTLVNRIQPNSNWAVFFIEVKQVDHLVGWLLALFRSQSYYEYLSLRIFLTDITSTRKPFILIPPNKKDFHGESP